MAENTSDHEYDPEYDPMFAKIIRGAQAFHQREMAALHERMGLPTDKSANGKPSKKGK
ncbi:hypothetical protein [Actinokineospora enzanensis]|uniref:hypothetical protein n=1 Tax=Actinokineospora enzanensis TaxID=155975 RepID=UPI000372CA80|nr:hypothetical protein [Actinokineospora enzanensis]